MPVLRSRRDTGPNPNPCLKGYEDFVVRSRSTSKTRDNKSQNVAPAAPTTLVLKAQEGFAGVQARLADVQARFDKTPAFFCFVILAVLLAAGFAQSLDLIGGDTNLPIPSFLRGGYSRLPRSWDDHRETNARNHTLRFQDINKKFCAGLQNKAKHDCLALPIHNDYRLNCFKKLVENTCEVEFGSDTDEARRCVRTSMLPFSSGNFEGGAREVNNNLLERPLVKCHATLPTVKVPHADIENALAAEKEINDEIDAHTKKTYDEDRMVFLRDPRFMNTVLFVAFFALPPSLVTGVIFSFELTMKLIYAKEWALYIFFLEAGPLVIATVVNIALVLGSGIHFTSVVHGGVFRELIKPINRCVIYANAIYFVLNASILVLNMNKYFMAILFVLAPVAYILLPKIGMCIIDANNLWKKFWNWLLEHDDIAINTEQKFRGHKVSVRVLRALAHVVYAIILLAGFTAFCHCFQIDLFVIYDHLKEHNTHQRNRIFSYLNNSWGQTIVNWFTAVKPITVIDIASA